MLSGSRSFALRPEFGFPFLKSGPAGLLGTGRGVVGENRMANQYGGLGGGSFVLPYKILHGYSEHAF